MRNYPSTKGEIADHLEFMAALLPDGIAGGEITVTVQSAFEELEQGLKNCRSRLGEIDFQNAQRYPRTLRQRTRKEQMREALTYCTRSWVS